jgi:hypothetical protein
MDNLGPIYAKYHKTPVQIMPNDISYFGAAKTLAFGLHRSRVTIEQYIFCKYGITLKYPHLPCMVMFGGNGHRSYYPFELLYIDKKERIKQQLNEKREEEMNDKLQNILLEE